MSLHDLDDLLSKCELPLPVEVIKSLVGVPFTQWKSPASDAWWWTKGHRQGTAKHGIWRRTKAVIRPNGKEISPARLLFQFFSQQKLHNDQRLAHRNRGMRGNDRDDVNPAHYVILQPDKKPGRSNKRNPHIINEVVLLMEMTNYFPISTDDLLSRWPEFNHHRKEDLDATVQTFYFNQLAEGFLQSTCGQHYGLAFTPEELVQLYRIHTGGAAADGVEMQITEKFGSPYKETTHGTQAYVVAGAMFAQWVDDMLSWEANGNG